MDKYEERPYKRRRRDSRSISSSDESPRDRHPDRRDVNRKDGSMKVETERRHRSRPEIPRADFRSRSPYSYRDRSREDSRHNGKSRASRKSISLSRSNSAAEFEDDEDRRSHRHQKRDRSRSPPYRRRRRRSRTKSPSPSRSKDHDMSSEYRRRKRNKDSDRRKHKHHSRRESSSSRSRSPGKSSREIEPHQRSKAPLPSQNDAFTSTTDPPDSSQQPIKQKPNFQSTGKLAALSNTIKTSNQTIVLKYHEPSESRKPPSHQPWRMYVFKDDEILETVELAQQSCWLFGRETAVCDFPIEHPSCSKQHAVVQFRYVERRNEYGDKVGKVKPYLIDLESSNGSSVNGERIPDAKYVELKDGDVVRFGSSTREYVVQLPPAK